MKVKELFRSIDLVGGPDMHDIEVSGISYHSQKVEPGHLFVCIRGYKTDGHKYLQDVKNRGAEVAIVEEIQDHIDIVQYQVKDARIALARLGAEFYGRPSSSMKMIGITATNGKTTTSYMANEILEKAGLTTGLIGTVNVKNGNQSIPSELTTPESLDLQYFLKEMVGNNVSHVTMEVSSAAMEMHRVESVNYDIVTLNNISEEHVDTHGSFERYFEVKSRLIREVSAESTAVLNLDDSYSASLIDRTEAQVVTFGIENEEGNIRCRNLDLSTGRARFTFEIVKGFSAKDQTVEPGSFEVELSVPGLHSVYNSMVAITIGLLNGIPVATIQAAMKEFNGVPRRFQFVYEDRYKIVDDHFANPGNIDVTLETLNKMDYNQLHMVYAIRGQRGPGINRDNAEVIAKWAGDLGLKHITATRSETHTTSKDKVTDAEVEAFMEVMDHAGINVTMYKELPDAIVESLTEAGENDLVLLAGCQGMDDGAEIATEYLRKN
ncbi:UDP-N-acetylmuramyl-tripeptide synthetase [Lentibacillus sediminis]|uniref:UDP-N-acetylmuramyl-tripeptide synthetase n=1 Tax=Lentibacillus sediminis TaxID=1940529 RepID=UPI000C1BD169|nr:UDP-N-acetylmuramyl-tripeptide synthetase [Lentibacillus sediminis]